MFQQVFINRGKALVSGSRLSGGGDGGIPILPRGGSTSILAGGTPILNRGIG